jgi:hypothetical protein
MGEPDHQTANFGKISAEMGIVELAQVTKHAHSFNMLEFSNGAINSVYVSGANYSLRFKI